MREINLSRKILENYDLSSKHLFKKKAGNAKYYYELKFDNTLDNDLKEILKLYKDNKKYKIFGMHTNLYITENGYDGLFIDLSPKGAKIKFDKEKEEFIVTSNLTNSKLVNYGRSLGYDFASFKELFLIEKNSLSGIIIFSFPSSKSKTIISLTYSP